MALKSSFVFNRLILAFIVTFILVNTYPYSNSKSILEETVFGQIWQVTDDEQLNFSNG